MIGDKRLERRRRLNERLRAEFNCGSRDSMAQPDRPVDDG
jgi:hypothetical protein